MDLIKELKARGLVDHSSAELEEVFSKHRVVYNGFDPSADSLQIGNLASIITMKRLALAGNKIVFLVGGGTGMIGDPKEKGERPMKDVKTVKANTLAIKKQFKQVLGKTPFKMVDNADWLLKEKLVSFLRDIGKYFTVNDLIKRDIIRKRLETPDESISYTEFTYALLQGFDYLVLFNKYKVDLQIGGSDQWTNMLSGVDLIHKKLGKKVYALGIPLITDADGKKFGKSEGNAIWLDAQKTSPFKFYQFWINLPDAGIERYFKVYTFLSTLEIVELIKKHTENPGARLAQETLAKLVTEMVHGKALTAQVVSATCALFGKVSFHDLSPEAQKVALVEAFSLSFSKKQLVLGVHLADVLVDGKLATSKSEAKRLITGGGVSMNSTQVLDENYMMCEKDFTGGFLVLKKGKQRVLILVCSNKKNK